jgi:hypothetical protein
MNLDEVFNLLDQNKNKQNIIPKTKFNHLFEILPAHDDGNCLFYSVEQLDSQLDFNGLRNSVCEYYKSFNKNGDYAENSIKHKLQMQMIADNEEDDGTLHQDNICNNLEWAGVMDVIALTEILKVNIILMIMSSKGYTVQPFIYNQRAKTIFIKYNGTNHFEPLLPNFNIKSPTPKISLSHSSSKYSSTKKKSSSSKTHKTMKNPLETAKSVSSETRKLIEQTMKNPLETAKSVSSETRKLIDKLGKSKKRGRPRKNTAKGTNKRNKKTKHRR